MHVFNHKKKKKKCIKSDFKEISLNLATNEWSDKTFLLTSKFFPLGAVCHCTRAIYMYKIMKKMYKIRLQRDFFETCNKWMKWQDSSVDIKMLSPGGCAPVPGLYTCIKSWKKLYKIRLQRHFFETCNKWMKWQDISVDIKTLSPGGCLPLHQGCIHV